MTSPTDNHEEPIRLLDLESDFGGPMSGDALGMLEAGRDCDPTDEEVDSLSAKLAPLVAPVAAAAAASLVTGIAATEAAKGGTSIAVWLKSLLLSKWIVTTTVVAGTTATAVAVTQIEAEEAAPAPAPVHVTAPVQARGALGPSELTPAAPLPEAIDEAQPNEVPVVPVAPEAPVAAALPQRVVRAAPSVLSAPSAPEQLEVRAPIRAEAPPTAAFPAVVAAPVEPPDEGELLSRAFASLQSGDAAGALRLTREHQRLTGTTLSQERERIAIEALVLLGQRSAAKTRADAFARRFPNSTYLPRIEALFHGGAEKVRSQ